MRACRVCMRVARVVCVTCAYAVQYMADSCLASDVLIKYYFTINSLYYSKKMGISSHNLAISSLFTDYPIHHHCINKLFCYLCNVERDNKIRDLATLVA